MKIRERFAKQLRESLPLTKEIVEKLQGKTYNSGDEIKENEKVLFGLLMLPSKDGSQVTGKFIKLNEREFDEIYELSPDDNEDSNIPKIVRVEEVYVK